MRNILVGIMMFLYGGFTYAQEWENYNSVYVPLKHDSARVFVCSQIDSITYVEIEGKLTQTIWQGGQFYGKFVSQSDTMSFFNPFTQDIIKQSDKGYTGEWEEIYVTPMGYFAYKSTLPYADDSIDKERYSLLSYLGLDGKERCGIVFSADTWMPLWLEADSMELYFSYTKDSLCSLALYESDMLTVLGDHEFSLSEMQKSCMSKGYGNSNLKSCLFYLVSLAEGRLGSFESMSELIVKFKTCLEIQEKDEPYAWAAESDRIWKIIVSVFDSGEEPEGDTYYSVVAITGSYYDLASNSCTATGSVRCATSGRDSYVTYGILCDENPDNLVLGKAQFNVIGKQEKLSLSYRVGLSGLKPLTKYYYRAYAKLKHEKVPVKIKYDNRNPNEVHIGKKAMETYGGVKSFTTLSPDITGTWTCTEEYFESWDKNYEHPKYKSYPVVLNKDGTVLIDGDSGVSSNWSYGKNGQLNISMMTYATTTANGGTDIKCTTDDPYNPIKFIGTTKNWNYNDVVGFVSHDAHKIELTR